MASSSSHCIPGIACIIFWRCQYILDLNGLAALRAGGNHGKGRLQQFLQALKIFFCCRRQSFVRTYTSGVALPAFYFFVDGFAGGEFMQVGGKTVNQFPLQAVCDTDFNSREGIEYIEFGDYGSIHPVQLSDKTPRDSVEPATAALPAGIRAIFVAAIAHLLSNVIKEFRGHGTAAYASDVGLVDADDTIDRARWQSCTAGGVGSHR